MAREWWPTAWRRVPWSRDRRGARQANKDALDFTIVITTCNRPHMLSRALASALRQTHDRYDIVVVDDASDRPVIIENSGQRHLKLVRSSRRLGFAAAINLGARHATGNWIAFLDDDDEYDPDLLRATHARIQAVPRAGFSWCSTVFLHYDGYDQPVRETVRLFREDFDSQDELLLATVSIGSGYGFAVNRQVFQELGGFDAKDFWAIADTEFFYRLIAAGYRPAVVAKPLMRVHKHNELRMTGLDSYQNRARQCELLRVKYAALIDQHPPLGEAIRTSIDQLSAMALSAESKQ